MSTGRERRDSGQKNSRPVPGENMPRDLTLTVLDNARHLTVSQCYLHLERIDDLIVKNGLRQRYMESRQFFERQLARCLAKRESPFHD